MLRSARWYPRLDRAYGCAGERRYRRARSVARPVRPTRMSCACLSPPRRIPAQKGSATPRGSTAAAGPWAVSNSPTPRATRLSPALLLDVKDELPTQYDLVLNTDFLSADQAVQLIAFAASNDQS